MTRTTPQKQSAFNWKNHSSEIKWDRQKSPRQLAMDALRVNGEATLGAMAKPKYKGRTK